MIGKKKKKRKSITDKIKKIKENQSKQNNTVKFLKRQNQEDKLKEFTCLYILLSSDPMNISWPPGVNAIEVTAPTTLLLSITFIVFGEHRAIVPHPAPTSNSPDGDIAMDVTPRAKRFLFGPVPFNTLLGMEIRTISPDVVPQYAISSSGDIVMQVTTRL